MGFLCNLGGHKWDGCVCKRCGEKNFAAPPEDHAWEKTGDCKKKCTRCGAKRDEHNWEKITDCLVLCADCGKKQISHMVGEQISSGYDSRQDLYYTDYTCGRCGRKFRNFDGHVKVAPGDERQLGTACIIDEKDAQDMKAP